MYPIVTNQDFAGGAFSGMNLCLFQQKVYFILGDGTAGGATTAVFANTTPLFTVWHHVVAQRIGNTPGNFKIYLDGVEVAKTVASSQFTTGDLEHTAVRDMKIGSRSGSIDNNAFQGSIKQVRIYKRILTATEIAANFNNGYFLGPTDVTQMVLWAPLNEGTGTQVKDYSTFNQQGNLVGSNVTWTNNYLPQQSALCPTYQEYQYHLKDHLGNVRMTFTTKDEVDTATATLEASHITDDRANFLNYDDARLVYSQLFDHTNGGSPGYAQRLSGSLNEKIGLSKSLSVMPGDVINAEVYAKYFDPNAPNLAAALQTLLSSLANPAGSGGTVIDGTGYSSASTLTTPWGAGTGTQSDQTVPKAFLNYLYINRNYDPASMRFKYKPISIAALEDGTDRLHELLSITDEISEAGYVYIYLSNDGEAMREVYFDDFRVEQVKSPVIQSQDFYPFGLTFGNYQRENSLSNQYQYNGKEQQDELNLGWLDYGVRMYDAALGRWWVVDPMAAKLPNWSPFRYAFNNPLKYTDVNGQIEWPLSGTSAVNKHDRTDGGWGLTNTIVRTSTYMDTNRPAGTTNPHIGIDYRATTGTDFYSLGDGKVSAIGSYNSGAKYITVEYGNGDKITFLHISSTADGLQVGSTVYEGQILGQTGSTGTKQPHLHVDGKDKDGNRIDPENQNYGTVTNEEFFTKYGGDYQKLKNAKSSALSSALNEPLPKNKEAKQDATRVANPWAIISSWLEQNPNIKVTIQQ